MYDNEDPYLDDDFQIKFYEQLLEKCPDFVQALSALGDLYSRKKKHLDGLKIDLRLVRLKPEDPIVHYNLACSYSLLNDTDRAFSAIQRAVDYGYRDFGYMKKDGDLHNLRKEDRFKQFFTRIRQVSDRQGEDSDVA